MEILNSQEVLLEVIGVLALKNNLDKLASSLSKCL